MILFFTADLKAQAVAFLNYDLEGIITSSSCLPDYWQNVPYGDPTCQATYAGGATPDLTDLSGPTYYFGIHGNPYSGSTFVSGVRSDDFQEGIMQTLTGLIPGDSYEIHFHQAVVKQKNCLDQSGSWVIYIDNTLAEITAATYSAEPYSSNNLGWEERSVSFIATSSVHTIKFLPYDDDANDQSSTTDIYGALRMGIDAIYIYDYAAIEMPNVFTPDQDGINDHFIPVIQIGIATAHLAIFDRWGKLIFETDDLQQGWDGTTNGNDCSDGTYYWFIHYTIFSEAQLSQAGFVTLLKAK